MGMIWVMRLLTLVRHAKSAWDYPELSDFERPLNERGRKDAPQMAKRCLVEWGKPERIVDSLRRIGRAPVFSFKHLSDSPAQEQAKRTYSRRNVDASMKTDRILCLLFTCHDRDVPCKIAS